MYDSLYHPPGWCVQFVCTGTALDNCIIVAVRHDYKKNPSQTFFVFRLFFPWCGSSEDLDALTQVLNEDKRREEKRREDHFVYSSSKSSPAPGRRLTEAGYAGGNHRHKQLNYLLLSRSTPVAQSAPRNLLTRWDVSSIPANGIFLTKN